MSSQFQPYLESIHANYEQRSCFYTQTDAEHKLDLIVQTVEAETPNEIDRAKKETIERLPVLEGLQKYKSEHVLLIGRPGSGKSTALEQLLLESVKQCQEDPALPIPVLVQLKANRSILSLIRKKMRKHRLPRTENDIDDLLFDGKLLLLLDGINEIPKPELRQELQEFRDNNLNVPMVFTTRDLELGGTLGIEKKLRMQPLTPEQLKEFVGKYLPKSGTELLGYLRDRLREIAETPLLLEILCNVFKQTGKIPRNKGELFQRFDQDYQRIKKDIEYVPVSENFWEFKSEVLQHLAFSMIQADVQQPTEPWLTIPKNQAETILESWLKHRGVLDAPTKAKVWLEDLLKHHLLQVADDPKEIEFHHQLFLEYYAAEALLNRVDHLEDERARLEDEQLKREFLNFLKWTEPVALMLGLLKNETQAIRIVKLGLEVDWMLGARLAGEICESLQSKTIDLIVKKPISEHFRLHLLGLIRSDTILPLITQALETEDNNICLTAVTILANLGTKLALEALVKTLDHRSYDVRRVTAVKLAEVVDQSVSQFTVSTLIAKVLNKPEAPEIRSSCMIALGKTRNQIAKCILQNIISDPLEKAIIRANAAGALIEADPQLALIDLQQALKDKDDTVSWSASLDLGRIGGQTVEAILCKALLDENSNARMNAALGLMSANCKTACTSLTRALQDQVTKNLQDELSNTEVPYSLWHLWNLRTVHTNVLIRLIEALKYLECTEASQSLLTLCEHTDLNVQASAVKAIGKIQKKKALPLLENLLNEISHFTGSEDHESYRRAIDLAQAAAEGLGETGCVEALFVLKRALTSPNVLVRANIILGLEKLRLKEILPILLNALSDSAELVRERAAMVFDNLGQDFIDKDDRQIISALLDYLEDENGTVRKHITQALWRIGGEAVSITQFIKALQDKESMSRMSAARRLGQIANKSDEISSALLDALEDEDIGVQTCAAEALGRIADPKLVSQLYQSQLVHQREYVSDAISAIQDNCKFYDYAIFQAHQAYLEAQKADRQTPQTNDRLQTAIANTTTIQVERLTLMTDKAPIFNQQNATIGVNYAAEGSKQDFSQHIHAPEQNFELLLTGYKQFIDELHQQNPNITDETEIIKTIDIEARRIDARWQNFLNLKRLWNGGKKAAVKVGEHFVEQNPWGKGAIAFLEGVSEDVK